MAEVNIDAWAAFAKKTKENAQNNSKSNSGSNSNYQHDYEEVQWAGLEKQEYRIVRLLGNPPESLTPGFKVGPTDAHEIFFSEVKDDQGKKMQLKLPIPGDIPDKDHIMWKIIRKVKELAYDSNHKKYNKWEKQFPDIFNRVAHGGWDPVKDFNQYKYSKGWSGQKVVIINCIDRENMAWHRENKHTMLLSREVSTSISNQDGSTLYWPSTGVPSYGFVDQIGGIVENYHNWEDYDLGIKRTGVKTQPYQVCNATAFKNGGLKEIPADKMQFISVDPLTEEERSWKRYDIEKLFAPSSYSKIEKRLGGTIKAIDAAFGTHFYDDIKALADKEAAELAALREQQNAAENSVLPSSDNPALSDDAVFGVAPEAQPAYTTIDTSTPIAPQPTAAQVAPAAPVMQTRAAPTIRPTAAAVTAAVENLTPEKISKLAGWSYLSDEQKAQIDDVCLDTAGKITEIKYKNLKPGEAPVGCPKCGLGGLMSHSHCVACGMDFNAAN